jgi:mRNA-degrading endonuclease RelE of RelBE toxin-antitoxin system
MNVSYSKSFIKSASKLSGKYKSSLKKKIEEVRSASGVEELTGCIKLESYANTYRLRIGDYRAFFIFTFENNTVHFEYLVIRGEAYSKEFSEALRKKGKI